MASYLDKKLEELRKLNTSVKIAKSNVYSFYEDGYPSNGIEEEQLDELYFEMNGYQEQIQNLNNLINSIIKTGIYKLELINSINFIKN